MMFDALLPVGRLTLALDVIAVIPWMAGMLTLPWVYVARARCSRSDPAAPCLSDVERRLMRRAIDPTMGAARLPGTAPILTPGGIGTGHRIRLRNI
ncbi:MAG TPA: CopD family protein [Acetobacteraceae bacterium]|nr:CopD family protein [Acetobacteraceae bacterium]